MAPMARIGAGAVLVIVAAYLMWFYVPGGQSELKRLGAQTEGSVQYKDSPPGTDGRPILQVAFMFQDGARMNRIVTRTVYDAAVWQTLQPGSKLRVFYLPDKPETASFEGAEGMASPRSAALRFLSVSMIIAGLAIAALGGKAWMQQQTPAARPPAGPRPAR
ncbi:MAG: hypothetical protein NT029_18370 [Armatimonadetes bacterium]|nr:hypothetical protein [Armatimonadota bacterium]